MGLPTKLYARPLYPYQKQIIDAIEQHRLLHLSKATGIGASELILRYLAYLCTATDDMKDKQATIIVGPKESLASILLDRIRKLFVPHGIDLGGSKTVLDLNGCMILCVPSHNASAARSLAAPVFSYCDESAFIPEFQRAECRSVMERPTGKISLSINGVMGQPIVIWCSTPSTPDSLHEELGKPETPYHKLRLDYKYAEGLLLSHEEIAAAKEEQLLLSKGVRTCPPGPRRKPAEPEGH